MRLTKSSGKGLGTALLAVSLMICATVAQAESSICQGVDGYAASFGGRRTFVMRPEWLSAIKARATTDPVVQKALKSMIAKADKALAGPNYSVVDKTRTPPSGDKHDYMSMGPYWWPDKTKAGGLPYIRRDGEVNPERNGEGFDVTRLETMTKAVEALSLAYYYTDDVRYAQKAGELIRVWFLNPATRMNPNATFAQAVPGYNDGRAEGVLDTSRMLRVTEGLGLLAPAHVLTDNEQKALETWFAQYSDWMMSSPTGKEERVAGNNHAILYDYQLVAFSLFARRPEVAHAVLKAFPKQRLDTQIEPDGKMPLELKRTRALHYSIYALQPAAGVAETGRCLGYDIWAYRSADGRGLKAALDFIAPYAGRGAEFPYPELKPNDTEGFFELLSRAAWAYGDTGYAAQADKLSPLNPLSEVRLKVDRYK